MSEHERSTSEQAGAEVEVQTLRNAWFARDQFDIGKCVWPEEHKKETGNIDCDEYNRRIDTLIRGMLAQQESTDNVIEPVMAPVPIREYVAWCTARSLLAADRNNLIQYAMSELDDDVLASWPSGPGRRCWCGSGRTYDRCCELPWTNPAATTATLLDTYLGEAEPGVRQALREFVGSPPHEAIGMIDRLPLLLAASAVPVLQRAAEKLFRSELFVLAAVTFNRCFLLQEVGKIGAERVGAEFRDAERYVRAMFDHAQALEAQPEPQAAGVRQDLSALAWLQIHRLLEELRVDDSFRLGIAEKASMALVRLHLASGRTRYLEEGIGVLQEAAIAVGTDSPVYSRAATGIAHLLLLHHGTCGHGEILDIAVNYLKCCAGGEDEEAPDLLAAIYQQRFAANGDLADIDSAIDILAGSSSAGGDVETALAQSSAYLRRAQALGARADYHAAVDVLHAALATIESGDERRVSVLAQLSALLRVQFDAIGGICALDEAIAIGEQIKSSDGGIAPSAAAQLGSNLRRRYEVIGSQADLRRAIEVNALAVRLCDHDDHARAFALNNLGLAVLSRYDRTGHPYDLDRALALLEQAVVATPAELPRDAADRWERLHSRLSITSRAVLCLPSLENARKAIKYGRLALDVTPSAVHRAQQLAWLGVALAVQAGITKVEADVAEAVATCESALQLLPVGYADRFRVAAALGGVLVARYKKDRAAADLHRAHHVLTQALSLPREELLFLPRLVVGYGHCLAAAEAAQVAGATDHGPFPDADAAFRFCCRGWRAGDLAFRAMSALEWLDLRPIPRASVDASAIELASEGALLLGVLAALNGECPDRLSCTGVAERCRVWRDECAVPALAQRFATARSLLVAALDGSESGLSTRAPAFAAAKDAAQRVARLDQSFLTYPYPPLTDHDVRAARSRAWDALGTLLTDLASGLAGLPLGEAMHSAGRLLAEPVGMWDEESRYEWQF